MTTSADAAALLERVSEGFLALDADGRVTYLNGQAARFFGQPAPELLGKIFPKALSMMAGRAFVEACHDAMRAQTPARFEIFSSLHNRRYECRAFPDAGGLSILLQDVTELRETQHRLEENEQRYRSLFERNPDAVFCFDLEGRFVAANAACEDVSGYTPQELLGLPFLPLVVPEDQARAARLTRRVVLGEEQREEIAILHRSGRRVPLDITKVPIEVDGAVVGIYGIARDITRRKAAEDALRDSEARLRLLAEAGPVAIVITRWSDGGILYANPYFRDLHGFTSGEDLHSKTSAALYVDDRDRAALLQALSRDGTVENWECLLHKLGGGTYWSSSSCRRVIYDGESAISAICHDITERRGLLATARAEAECDPLTGLLNHRAFFKRLGEELEWAAQNRTALAVGMLDLDNFKFFNDAYTHAAGDEVLRQVADALRGVCRAGDTLARFGGDEFALLMPLAEMDTPPDALLSRLHTGLRGIRFQPAGHDSAIPIVLSAGVALFPGEAATRQDVMHLADERLQQAKNQAGSGAEAQQEREYLRHAFAGFPMLDALVTAVDSKDRYTRRHSEDVMHWSGKIARHLGLSEADRHLIAVAALLHDVGKIAVPDPILRKPGRLTEAEFEAMKMHSTLGAMMIHAVPELSGVLDAVRHHHERWDGGGYPDRLAGQQIPFFARLLAVADAFSAMTADRPYREALTPDTARRILKDGAGTQWDPACVEAFLAD